MEIYTGEKGYTQLINFVLNNGYEVTDRTGVGSVAIFDAKVVYDIGEFPFSTIRPAGLRLAFEEFWMFMRGETDTILLEEKGINFWKGNTSEEFLAKRGLSYLPPGNMGKAYGYQWRSFNDTFDQLVDIVNTLRTDPFSRRLYTTFWNPSQSDQMALTPCWHSHQFVVLPQVQDSGEIKLTLHLKLFNRSLDIVFGYPFAIQQYKLYQIAVAKMLGLEAGFLSADLTHVHIYNNQIEYAKELIQRPLGQNGTVTINKDLNSLDDILSLQWEDIQVDELVVNNTPFSTPRPPMAV